MMYSPSSGGRFSTRKDRGATVVGWRGLSGIAARPLISSKDREELKRTSKLVGHQDISFAHELRSLSLSNQTRNVLQSNKAVGV